MTLRGVMTPGRVGVMTPTERPRREIVALAAFKHRWSEVYPLVESGERPLPNEMLLEADAILAALGWGRQA